MRDDPARRDPDARVTGRQIEGHPCYTNPPASLARNDFWQQVKRTIGGEPVDDRQVDLIVAAIRHALSLDSSERLLDLACGNGALTSRLYPSCAASVGVDSSEYLISVANQFFAKKEVRSFVLDDVAHFVSDVEAPERFDKVLCYGSFPYLSDQDAFEVLLGLNTRFPQVSTVFLGNLPDLALKHLFYYKGQVPSNEELADPMTSIGIWRSEHEIVELAGIAGWRATVTRMPAAFYASHYRFDATLTRMSNRSA